MKKRDRTRERGAGVLRIFIGALLVFLVGMVCIPIMFQVVGAIWAGAEGGMELNAFESALPAMICLGFFLLVIVALFMAASGRGGRD